MKKLLIALLLFASPLHAAEFHLDWNATFVPPHNEPVLWDMVARYRLQLNPQVKFEYLDIRPQLNVWGVNTWIAPNKQLSTSWFHDDWSIEEVRYTYKVKAFIGPESWKIRPYTEYYDAINGGKGATSFGSYWWLIGVSGRLF